MHLFIHCNVQYNPKGPFPKLNILQLSESISQVERRHGSEWPTFKKTYHAFSNQLESLIPGLGCILGVQL